MKLRTSLLTLALCLFALKGFSLDMAPAGSGNNQAQLLTAMSGKMGDNSDRKLSFKEKLALKIVKKKAEKMQKKMAAGHLAAAEPGIDKGAYVIVAILIPFLAVGLATNFQGSDWLICLLLTFLFYIPGLIYALIKMNTYYA